MDKNGKTDLFDLCIACHGRPFVRARLPDVRCEVLRSPYHVVRPAGPPAMRLFVVVVVDRGCGCQTAGVSSRITR